MKVNFVINHCINRIEVKLWVLIESINVLVHKEHFTLYKCVNGPQALVKYFMNLNEKEKDFWVKKVPKVVDGIMEAKKEIHNIFNKNLFVI